jgi:hypothetical protein
VVGVVVVVVLVLVVVVVVVVVVLLLLLLGTGLPGGPAFLMGAPTTSSDGLVFYRTRSRVETFTFPISGVPVCEYISFCMIYFLSLRKIIRVKLIFDKICITTQAQARRAGVRVHSTLTRAFDLDKSFGP